MDSLWMPDRPSKPPLEQQLLQEGWSLHQRLCCTAQKGLLPESEALANHWLKSWLQVAAPDDPANFEKRLDWDGLTTDTALWALNPDPADCPQDPHWWPRLQLLRQAARDSSGGTALAERGITQPFVHAWRPAADWALQTLKQRCTDLHGLLRLSNDAWLDLGEALLERFCSTTDQALYELFNQRRTPGQILLAHLGANSAGRGEPVHEAYDALVIELLSSGYGLLLEEFPVLGRLLATIAELWLEGSEEMLRRLAANRLALQQHFEIAPQAVLHRVQLGLSDPHREDALWQF